MARNTPVNHDLAEALQPYAHAEAVKEGVLFSLGVRPGDSLTEKEYPVNGFFLRATDDVFSFYALTPGRFILFEMSTSGDTLTVVIPASRIRRVVEESIAKKGAVEAKLVVTVEVDADRRVTRTESETLEALLPEEENNPSGRVAGRGQSSSVETFSVYRIESKDEAENDMLWYFALALRNFCGE